MADPAYLLDSNICIYVLKGFPPETRRRVEACLPGEIVTSAVAYAEVIRGFDQTDAHVMGKVEALFRIVEVLPFDRAAAAAYRAMSFRRTSYDRLIAAHAYSLSLTFVTNNVRDFRSIAGLKIENWTEA